MTVRIFNCFPRLKKLVMPVSPHLLNPLLSLVILDPNNFMISGIIIDQEVNIVLPD